MINSAIEKYDWFEKKDPNSKIHIILIVIALATNFYHISISKEKRTEFNSQMHSKDSIINGLNRINNNNVIRYNNSLTFLQSKVDTCNNQLIRELRERSRRNERLAEKSDRLYQKVKTLKEQQ